MSDNMMRKQLYIPKRLNLFLKRAARQRGVSESEVIRQALERDEKAATYPLSDSADGWEKIRRFVKERQMNYSGQGKPVQWNRQELYEESEEGK
jgi:hypothetical protein